MTSVLKAISRPTASESTALDRGDAALRPSFSLDRDDWGALVLVDEEGDRHAPVEPVRGFPLSDPDRWISLCNAEGRELVVVEDLAALEPRSRRILSDELARREFVPVIRRILSMPVDSEPTEWQVETDRGITVFQLNSADDVRRLAANRVLVIDARGIRYLIEDTRLLDALGQRVLERYL